MCVRVCDGGIFISLWLIYLAFGRGWTRCVDWFTFVCLQVGCKLAPDADDRKCAEEAKACICAGGGRHGERWWKV